MFWLRQGRELRAKSGAVAHIRGANGGERYLQQLRDGLVETRVHVAGLNQRVKKDVVGSANILVSRRPDYLTTYVFYTLVK